MTTKTPQLAIDLSETSRFLEIIAPNGDVTFQTFDDDKKRKDPRLCRILHGATDENFVALTQLNNSGAGVFFMVNQGDGKGRKTENVQAVRAMFVDLDENGEEGLAKILKFPRQPRAIVESSPGKFHAYWLINGKLSRQYFPPMQRCWAEKFGGDPAVGDLPRVMRLPGFYHRKGEPFMSRIIEDNADAAPLPVSVLIELAEKLTGKAAQIPAIGAGTAAVAGVNDEYQVGTAAAPEGITPQYRDAFMHIKPEPGERQPYSEWIRDGMAAHWMTGGSDEGLELWIEQCHEAKNFDEAACRRAWASFDNSREGGVTAGTIYHLAKEKGWKERLSIAEEPQPLPDELLPVAQFDFSLLPDSLRPWAKDICERVQCPPDFVGAGIMASLAAVLGRKIGIRPQARTDWTVVPNLWAMVIGRPGVLKSPALEATLAPLNRLVAKANDEHAAAFIDYQKKLAIAKMKAAANEATARKALAKNSEADVLALLTVDEPVEPTLKRYKANDTSPASLGELLRQNPNGLLVYRDELVSLLKGLDREDQAEGRGFYLTAWTGDSSYTIDRIGRGLNLNIEAVCLSILGGTQPGKLAEYIRQAVKGGAADDGLIQRFGLLVWPDTCGTWKDVDRWPDTEAKNQAFNVFVQLEKLDLASIQASQDTDSNGIPEGIPYLRFDAEGHRLFLEWRTELELRLRGGDLHPALESHFSKYRKLVPALALILHLADGGSGPVTGKSTKQAIAWSKYLETHAMRAYGAVSHHEVVTAKAILRRIKKGDLPNSFSSRDVWRPGWSMLSDRDQVISGLRLLVDYGHLREDRNETGGRPSTTFHVIAAGV